ncbi:MAG: alkaline phosphatase [Bacteroidota bacterium]
MARQLVFTFFFLASGLFAEAQPTKYTIANVHAHNDYDHNVPFSQAHDLQLGSIEADVLWINDTLFVAHGAKYLKRDVLFEGSYLQKLANSVKENKGYAYADTSSVLQLLIDIKTDSLQTLNAVIKSIEKFPILVNRSVRFVITGNQLPAEQFNSYPAYILFDGKINDASHIRNINRIGLFSADFSKYSKWKGEGDIPAADLALLKTDIAKAHALHRQIRFWGVPDNARTWRIMMDLGVDYINTDQIAEVARFVAAGK